MPRWHSFGTSKHQSDSHLGSIGLSPTRNPMPTMTLNNTGQHSLHGSKMIKIFGPKEDESVCQITRPLSSLIRYIYRYHPVWNRAESCGACGHGKWPWPCAASARPPSPPWSQARIVCVSAVEHDVGEHFRHPKYQWEFQDPKMEVLYHIRPYFAGIFPYIALT